MQTKRLASAPGFLKRHPLAASAAGILLAAAAIYSLSREGMSGDSVAPTRGPIVESVYGLGTVTSARTYNLRVGVTTHIVRVFVAEGDKVEKGANLVELFDAGIQRAPFSGTVTGVAYKAGETVFPQSTIVSLVDLTELYVLVSLEQQAVLRVQPGQTARLSFESIRGEKVAGRVRAIYPSEGQFWVRVDVGQFPREVLPSMTVDVAIEVARRENALLIPVRAIQAGKIVATKGRTRRKIDVRIGAVDGEWAEVVSGDLSPGEKVLVRGR